MDDIRKDPFKEYIKQVEPGKKNFYLRARLHSQCHSM